MAAVNSTLEKIAGLSERLAGQGQSADARLALQDELGTELDALSEYIDFTTRTDSKGRIEIFTGGGTALITGGEAETLSFDTDTGILTAGEIEITPGVAGKRGISEGSLSGKIELVTTVLPEMRSQLDEVARALIDGMVAADASLAAGEAGLFTDNGAALSDPFEPGLASRISVNDAVVPESGGSLWRIRDGLGADAPGPAGDNTQVTAFLDTLDGAMNFDESLGLGDNMSLSSYISTLIASQNTTRASAETSAESLAAGAIAVQSSRLSFMGVNVDDELQQLAAIQQSYNANAQTLSVVSEMLDTLLSAI